jgi:hypothetical protein
MQPLLQLFRFHGIFKPNAPEMLRREVGNSGELEGFFFRKGVADFDGAVVVYADDVAGVGFLNIFPGLGHEYGGIGNGNFLADAVVNDLHPPFEYSGTNPQKGDAVPMGHVHIGLNFKDKS